MTREEIKNTPEIVDFMLDKSVVADSRIKLHNRIEELCKLAIKALELEPYEDCISRQAVKELFQESEMSGEYSFLGIDDLPSVIPQTKTGYWILTDVEGNRVWHCNCSECGEDPQTYIGGSKNWWLIKNKLPKYCPNCGAKMKGE